MQRILISGIKAYQYLLSPFLGANCRFNPTCSQYTNEAIAKHGALKGLAMGVSRICRCHPFCKGGHDPVPE